MSKKNDKRAIQKRHNIVKKQMVDQQRKRQERRNVKELCSNIKNKLQTINIGFPKSGGGGDKGIGGAAATTTLVEEVEMTDVKPIRRGNNFIRELGTGEKLTARRKKVLKQALKRRRKLGGDV